jgi:twitching motility protein PilT
MSEGGYGTREDELMAKLTAANRHTADVFLAQALLAPDAIDRLIRKAETLQEWIGQVAIDDSLVSPEAIAAALAVETKLPLADLSTLSPQAAAMELLARDTCLSNLVLPLTLKDGVLQIAVANPFDPEITSTIVVLVQAQLAIQIAPLPLLGDTIRAWYGASETAAPVAGSAPRSVAGYRNASALLLGMRETSKATPEVVPPKTIGADEMYPVGVDELLEAMMAAKASDLHLTVGSPPLMRVHGALHRMPFPVMLPMHVKEIVYAILTDEEITTYERHLELDFAYSIARLSRFRVNVFRQRGSTGAVLRAIPMEIPTLAKLGMPPIVKELTSRPRGLILVTGPTGSGKSTTLAAMIDEINSTRRAHIMTIEDPVEFLHKHKHCEVNQREIGSDTESFATALRHVLRQDPDVILIGEMRDLETTAAALTAAETGHLVLATLHTTSAMQTVDRVIDVFPPHQQEQVRNQLSNVLEGILCQTLLPTIDGRGRACAQEVMVATPAIRNLIREGKVHQMASVIQSSSKYGMQTLDQALRTLVMQRVISLEEATLKAANADDFRTYVAMR